VEGKFRLSAIHRARLGQRGDPANGLVSRLAEPEVNFEVRGRQRHWNRPGDPQFVAIRRSQDARRLWTAVARLSLRVVSGEDIPPGRASFGGDLPDDCSGQSDRGADRTLRYVRILIVSLWPEDRIFL